MSAIWLVIKEAATSKKFIMAIAGSIAAAAMEIGLELPPESIALILSPIVAYIVGQGWADRGKEAAKVDAIAGIAARSNTTVAEEARAIKAIREA